MSSTQFLKPLVISGPSGVGKTFLVRELLKSGNYTKVLSTTTRVPRIEEINAQIPEYRFVSVQEYQKLQEDGKFYMSNNFLGYDYAQTRGEIEDIQSSGKRPVIEIYAPVMYQFVQEYTNYLGIYLYPDNLDIIKKHLWDRSHNEEHVNYRLSQVEKELEIFDNSAKEYYHKTFIVKNNDDIWDIKDEIEKMLDQTL